MYARESAVNNPNLAEFWLVWFFWADFWSEMRSSFDPKNRRFHYAHWNTWNTLVFRGLSYCKIILIWFSYNPLLIILPLFLKSCNCSRQSSPKNLRSPRSSSSNHSTLRSLRNPSTETKRKSFRRLASIVSWLEIDSPNVEREKKKNYNLSSLNINNLQINHALNKTNTYFIFFPRPLSYPPYFECLQTQNIHIIPLKRRNQQK